jgi:hypothetical protein
MNKSLRFRIFSACALVSILCLSAAHLSWAQINSGSISGTIVDSQKGVVVDANVKARDLETNKEYETTSDSSGLFRFNLLPSGTYHLEISKTGFRKLILDHVGVSVGADQGLGVLQLEVGEITTSVEVSSSAPLIESTQAQVTTAISVDTLTTFPGILENQGLDFLALSVPGVVNNRDLGFSNTNGTGFAVNGLRGRSNDQQIDGQNNNDNSVAGPSLAVSDPEFVSEYQITTSNFGAEYGRNSGSVVNIVTKSGSNNLHGSLYGTESNQRFDALSSNQKAYEGLTKVPTVNDLFLGGTVGGPIIKDKLFFFGGDNAEILNQGSVFGTGLLTPTPAGIATLASCYAGSPGVTALQNYGPWSIKGGNPTQQGTAQLVDLGTCTGVEENGIQRTLPTDSRQYNFVVKLDFQTAKNQFYGRYIYSNTNFFNVDPGSGGAAAGYSYNEPGLSQDYGFSWTRNINSHMANEFRASYGRINVDFGSNNLGNTIPPQTNLESALANIIFNDTKLLTFGPLTNLPQGRIVNTYQGQDNWTYFKGRNAFKAGVNFTYQRSPNAFLPNVNGQYRFTDYGQLSADVPNRIRIASGNPNLDFREKDTFLYVQDDVKLTSSLTINAGLTWSYYGQPANLFHTLTTKSQQSSTPLWDPTLPLSVTTFPSIPAPKNSFGPNIGFAWSPGKSLFSSGGGKTVIRGGYRLAYDPPFYNIYLNISSAAPNVLLNTLTGTAATSNPMPADPHGPNVRAALAPFLTTGIFDPRSFNYTSITHNFGPDKVHSWSLGVQQELAKNAVLEVRYVGNHGSDLFQSINGNPYILGLATNYPNLVPAGETPCPAADAAVPLAVGRVNCNLGIVRERTNSGYSNYQAVQTELRLTHIWNQLTLKSSYTFSKTLDNSSEIFATGGAGGTNAFAQSQVNYTGQEYGISGLDFPNNWALTVVEDLPMYRSQHGFVGHTLGGWSVSAIYTLSSGQPYTPSQGALNCSSGGGACEAASSSNPYDPAFNGAFVGADGALRPYWGNPAAPTSSVGIYAGDACSIYAVTGTEPICQVSPTTLVSLNGINATSQPIGSYTPQVVSKSQVRFIANTAMANSIFGTPFGNVGRNVLRDFHTNQVNIGIFKTTNITERVRVQFHADFINALNHPNYQSIDPFIDDAGLVSEFTGFANPYVQNGGIPGLNVGRSIRFGLKLSF